MSSALRSALLRPRLASARAGGLYCSVRSAELETTLCRALHVAAASTHCAPYRHAAVLRLPLDGRAGGDAAAYSTSSSYGARRDVAPAIITPDRYKTFVDSAALVVTQVSKLGEMHFGTVRACEKGFDLKFPVRIVTPPLVTPSGVREKKAGGAYAKAAPYFFALQLGEDSASAAFELFLGDLERMAKDAARENAVRWWGEPKSAAWLDASFKSLVTEPPEDDAAGGDRPPARLLYFNVRSLDALTVKLRPGPEGRESRAVHPSQQLPARALVSATLDLTGIWHRPDRFGLSLKPVELAEAGEALHADPAGHAPF